MPLRPAADLGSFLRRVDLGLEGAGHPAGGEVAPRRLPEGAAQKPELGPGAIDGPHRDERGARHLARRLPEQAERQRQIVVVALFLGLREVDRDVGPLGEAAAGLGVALDERRVVRVRLPGLVTQVIPTLHARVELEVREGDGGPEREARGQPAHRRQAEALDVEPVDAVDWSHHEPGAGRHRHQPAAVAVHLGLVVAGLVPEEAEDPAPIGDRIERREKRHARRAGV